MCNAFKRIADFMRDTGGEQRERLHALAFNGFKSLLPRLGGIVQMSATPELPPASPSSGAA